MMKSSLFVMVIALHAACKTSSTPGQEICEVFPKNQLVKYGSDVVLFFRAPFNSDCYKKTGLDPSRVSWKLNNKMIAQDFYKMIDNSTFSVSIPDFSLTTGTVEFLMDDNVLSGTLIRTYTIPQNISCLGETREEPILTCTWAHDQYTLDTKYRVIMKMDNKNFTCTSKKRSCEIKVDFDKLKKKIKITVIAETPAVHAPSKEVLYDHFLATIKLSPPEGIKVKPELNGLRVTWNTQMAGVSSCQVRQLAEGSEPVVEDEYHDNTLVLTELKECTKHYISVRCRISIWSEWSQNVMGLTSFNVSNVKFHLWRSRSVTHDKGKRKVHLMWKGIPPSCEAFDEYRLFDQTRNLNLTFKPSENHTFIDLDENMHRISLAAFSNNRSLGGASIEIPSTAEDLNLPPVTNVSLLAGGGQIHVTWDKPNLTVSGYLIVWNTTKENHMWQQTQDTHFSLKGENFTLYTISLTPLYENGPGTEIRRQLCFSRKKDPATVSNIRADKISDRKTEIHWEPISPTVCCASVVSYTVFYKTQNEEESRNMSADEYQHSVILNDLKPSTTYVVRVQVNAATASSQSGQYMFSTKLYGEDYLIGIIVCSIGLLLLAVLFITLRKEYLSVKVPNPRFSSLSLWSSQKCRHPWNPLPMPWSCESEKILTCQVEAEDREVGKLKASNADHNFHLQKTTTAITTQEKENTALPRPNEIELASNGKKEQRQPLLAVDHQVSQIHPILHTQSPYRNQTPATSPVDSPSTVFPGTAKSYPSEERQTLLKPKPQNTASLVTYVTVDMFEQAKGLTKRGVP